MNLEVVLTTLLASSASAAIVAFLSRSLVTHWLDKDIEKYKIELTAKLEKAAMEHQVRFTRLHEKRTYLIATIYSSVETLHGVLRSWNNVQAILRDDPAAREREAVAFRALATKAKNSLEIFYYRRAIWLERDLCNLLNQLISSLSLLLTMLDAEGKGAPIVTQGKNDSRELANEVLGIATATRTALEKRFRAILGIADTDAP